MDNAILCPNCQGNKIADLGNGVCKCLYCGTAFSPKHNDAASAQPAAQPAAPPVVIIQQPQTPPYAQPHQMYVGGKSKSTAGILSIFFGCFGVARFYVGDIGLGLLYLLLTVVISLFSFGLGFIFIGSLLCIIDLLYFACMSEHTFNRKYNHLS